MRHKFLRWCVVHQTVVGTEIRDKRVLNGCRIVRLDTTLLRKIDLEKLRLYFLANAGRKPQNEFFWKKASGKVVRIRSR